MLYFYVFIPQRKVRSQVGLCGIEIVLSHGCGVTSYWLNVVYLFTHLPTYLLAILSTYR